MNATVPLWVFAVLAGLLYLGYVQSRPRQVTPRTMAITALAMLVFSLYGVIAAFSAQALPLTFWALGIAGSVSLGRWLFGPRRLSLGDRSGAVHVPGSWLPLVLFMGIFGVKFVLGFAAGMRSPLLAEPLFIAGVSASLGLLSGAFSARSLTVVRFARSSDPVRLVAG